MGARSSCPLKEHWGLRALGIACLSIVFLHCGREQSGRGSGELGAATGGGDSGISLDAGSPDGVANDDAAASDEAAAEASQGDADDAAADSGREGGQPAGGEDANCIQPPTPLATGSTLSPHSSSLPPTNWVAYSTYCIAYPFTTSTTALLLAISKHDSLGSITSCGIVDGCNPTRTLLASAPGAEIAATVQGPGTYTFTTCIEPDVGGLVAMEYHVEDVPPPATNIDCDHPQAISTGVNEPRVIDGLNRYYSFTHTSYGGSVTLLVTPLEDSGGTISVSVRTVCSDAQTEIGKTQALLGEPTTYPIPMYGLNVGTYYVAVSNIPFANRYALSTQ